MNTMTKTLDHDTVVNELTAMLNNVRAAITEVSEYIAKIYDDDKTVITAVTERCGLSSALFMRFYSIGKGLMDKRLIMNESPGARTLRKLPLDIQATCLDNGVVVATSPDDSVIVQVADLTKAQATQAFDSREHTIRDLLDQRRLMTRNRATPTSGVVEGATGGVQVNKPCFLSDSLLASLGYKKATRR
jgi:hypothetical protein